MDICAHWFAKVKKQSKAMKNIVLDLIYIILNYFVCYVPCWHFRKLCYLFHMEKNRTKRRQAIIKSIVINT